MYSHRPLRLKHFYPAIIHNLYPRLIFKDLHKSQKKLCEMCKIITFAVPSKIRSFKASKYSCLTLFSLCSLQGCHLDPLLDDSVMFARRLRDLGIPVELNLVDDLPHGFLNFALLSVEARQAADLCGRKISDMLSDSV